MSTPPDTTRAATGHAAGAAAPVAAVAEPVVLTVGARALANRYDELRPQLNYGAAQLHWAMQFVPVPGNVRFHAWTFYQHFVDPMAYSMVHNAAAVLDGTAPVDASLAALADDTFSALGNFVAAELSGHSNVVPPNSDAAGGLHWAHWAIEVAVAPLYYLPAPPALIVQVPIVARFGVDVADRVATEFGAVLTGARTPAHAVRTVGEFVRDDAIPRLVRAEKEVFTPPPAPQPSAPIQPARVTPPDAPGDAGGKVLRNISADEADESARATAPRIKTLSPARTAGRAESVERMLDRTNAPRAVQRLNRHNSPRATVRAVDGSKKQPSGAGRTDDVE
ncbi:hypothetical protein [Mycolicibacterium thermoresistibile]